MRRRPQDKNVLPKRVSDRIFEQGGVIKVPEIASQDRRTVVQYLDVSVEVNKNVLQERISERVRNKLSREYLQCDFQLCRYWMILRVLNSFDAETLREKRC